MLGLGPLSFRVSLPGAGVEYCCEEACGGGVGAGEAVDFLSVSLIGRLGRPSGREVAGDGGSSVVFTGGVHFCMRLVRTLSVLANLSLPWNTSQLPP